MVHLKSETKPLRKPRQIWGRIKSTSGFHAGFRYYQLSFTWRGKSRTRFVRAERLADVQHKIVNYKRFRELSDEWVDLVVEREQLEREQAQ